MFIATCTERELRKRKKRKFSLWVRQCSSTGFIIQVRPGRVGAEGTEGNQSAAHVPLSLCVARMLHRGWAGPPLLPGALAGRRGPLPTPASLGEITAVKTLTSTQSLAVSVGGFTETAVTGGDNHLPESALCGRPRPAPAPHLLPASVRARHMGVCFIRGA